MSIWRQFRTPVNIYEQLGNDKSKRFMAGVIAVFADAA